MNNCEMMYESFCKYFPSEIDNVYEYREDSLTPYELILKYHNGSIYIFNTLHNSIRKIQDNIDNISEDEWKREFGRRLRRQLSYKGYTQSEFANLLEVTQPIVNGYINGKNIPSSYVLRKMATILGCSMDDLCFR